MNHIRKTLALFLILLTYGHALSQQQPAAAAPAVPVQPQSTPTPAAEPSAPTPAPSQTPAMPESTPAKPADTKPTDQPVPPAAPPVTTTAEPTKPPAQEQKAAASGPGLSVKNNTEYPATLTLTITPGTQVIQKDIPAKQTVELLHEPLSNTATYIVSGSLFKTVTTRTIVTILSGSESDKKPKESINTNVHRIASSKNWSATNLAGQTVELVLELIEKPGSEPLFEINQSPAAGKA